MFLLECRTRHIVCNLKLSLPLRLDSRSIVYATLATVPAKSASWNKTERHADFSVVINAFDWLSRIPAADGNLSGLSATVNKPVALMSASPGAGGALRSMNFMRQYLQMAFAMIVVPQQFALGVAHEAFDEAGTLKDSRAVRSVETVLQSLSNLALAVRVVR